MAWKLRKSFYGLSYVMLGLLQSASAQFVEVALKIEGTSQSSRTYNSRCVFGTNTWMIEGEFSANAKTTFWCTETNIIEHDVVTKKLPPREKSIVVMTSPEVGERFTKFWSLGDESPLFGVPYVNWLAFCSGSFLNAKGRQLRPFYPGLGNTGPYTDKTQSFNDGLGLPERVEIYRGDGKLVCAYAVQQSTNFSGWTIPVRFTATEYRASDGHTAEPVNVLVATVSSIREATVPVVPPEVLKKPNP